MLKNPFRVMVVDEDADVRFVVTSLLGLEFETVQAQNGLDALEKIDRYQPDLLLMEVNMPIMNGIACCKAIQRHEDFRHLPVFFMAASSNPEMRRLALESGGKDYIEKPFDSTALIDKINGYLESSGLTPAEKAYSVAQIAQIDASPLEAVSSEAVAVGEVGKGAAETPLPEEERKVEGRKRRVFGKRQKEKKASSPPTPPPDAESKIELPEPPKPDYRQVSARLAKQRLAKEEKPAEPAKPPSTPKPPKAEPQKASAEEGPSPAEILAQRRLGAIGKKPSRDTVKPRVLVLIDEDRQLQICHAAMKGVAEFLPLEDPVEAVELIARFQPDIVMAGIRTQKYSGLQLAQMLRSNPRLSHIEILFVQGPHVEEKHLKAAQSLTKNPIVRMPLDEPSLKKAIQEMSGRRTFKVREKKLGYGVYVKEVIRKAEEERARDNKEREARSYERHHHSLAKFMASELQGYKDPEGYEELLGIGRKEHRIAGSIEEE